MGLSEQQKLSFSDGRSGAELREVPTRPYGFPSVAHKEGEVRL